MCVVGRRYRERRASEQPFSAERRRADRRRLKEQLVEVILSARTKWPGPTDRDAPQIASLFFQENLANGLLPH